MLTLLAFIVTIIIIVAFHEWGHFLAMRAFGVQVQTFSVGFGPKLLQFVDKKGTQWVISAVPLGGYVKPLDSRDDETAEGVPGEFSSKPAWQRVVVYAAGPVFNFILALLIYWVVMLSFGEAARLPTVGIPVPQTPAEQAGFQGGDRIVSVDGKEVESWQGVINGMILHIGEAEPLRMQVEGADGTRHQRNLDIQPWSVDPEQPPLDTLGLTQAVVIGGIQEGSAAAASRLQVGDTVLSLDGERLSDWLQWQEAIQQAPEQTMTAEVLREGQLLAITFTPQSRTVGEKTVGVLGVTPQFVHRQFGPVEAVAPAMQRFIDQSSVVWASIRKLITGHLPLEALGGPVTIAQVAGETAAIGLASFLGLLAYLSITLGMINLLPIPMLDGGWILFGIIEMIRGRSLPERFLIAAQGVGLMLVVSFMLLAIYNDLVRQFS